MLAIGLGLHGSEPPCATRRVELNKGHAAARA